VETIPVESFGNDIVNYKYYIKHNSDLESVAKPSKSTVSLIGKEMNFILGERMQVLITLRDKTVDNYGKEETY